jgi:membrane protease YdiL (CAAX protease family)
LSTFPLPTLLAFAVLMLAMTALWVAPASSTRRDRFWTFPFAVALAAAIAGGVVDVRGVLVLLLFAVACRAASQAGARGARAAAYVVLFLVCGGLMLHVMPGFDNPIVISGVVLSPGAPPYTKYLNFDKAAAGLLLLGLYAPQLVARPGPAKAGPHGDPTYVGAGFGWPAYVVAFAWRFAVLTSVVIVLALLLGFVRWDPKLPAWFPFWALSILFFTALPEEALFRGVVQTTLERRLGGTRHARVVAMVIAAVLFGIAHAGGGATYVLLATVAGAGYGWIYADTHSIGAAILAHFGLDAIHFLFFTYPALALHY